MSEDKGAANAVLQWSISGPQQAVHPALPVQVIYLVRDVWRGLSARGDGHVLPGGDKGFQRSLKDLTLTRCIRVRLSVYAWQRCEGPASAA